MTPVSFTRDFTVRPPTHPVKAPKLVRDFMPEFHARDKCVVEYRVLTDDKDFLLALAEKLREEVEEFIENPSVEEWADVDTVLTTMGEILGITINDMQKAKGEKTRALGRFRSRLLMTRFEWGPEIVPDVVIRGPDSAPATEE